MTQKPKISIDFQTMMQEKAQKGRYCVDVAGIPISVFPYVFPPQSPFSQSTHTVYDAFGRLEDQTVLDIGSGTGIQAIQAALSGAQHVDAVDINQTAVGCTRYNVTMNNLSDRIDVWQSDLFSTIPEKAYDLIIANLPIVDVPEKQVRLHSLYDPGFKYHHRLFRQAGEYLAPSGRITLCHADLQPDGFARLEDIAQQNGYAYAVRQRTHALGYEWRNYDFQR